MEARGKGQVNQPAQTRIAAVRVIVQDQSVLIQINVKIVDMSMLRDCLKSKRNASKCRGE